MAFNIFSTLNQNLQNFGGDAYDAYQAGKSKVGNVASTINNNLQDFGGDIYDVGSTIKKNVSNFGTQTYNQGKQAVNQIQSNVSQFGTDVANKASAVKKSILAPADRFMTDVTKIGNARKATQYGISEKDKSALMNQMLDAGQYSDDEIIQAVAQLDAEEKARKQKEFSDWEKGIRENASTTGKILGGAVDFLGGAEAGMMRLPAGVTDFVTGGTDYTKDTLKGINDFTSRSGAAQVGDIAGQIAGTALIPGVGRIAPSGTSLAATAGRGAVYGGAFGGLTPIMEKGSDATASDIGYGALGGAAMGAVAGPLLEKVVAPAIGKVAQSTTSGLKAAKFTQGSISDKIGAGLQASGKNISRGVKSIPMGGETLTRNIPKAIVKRDLGFTPTQRAKIENITGGDEAQYILKKGLAGKPKEELAQIFMKQADDAYNGITTKLAKIDKTVKSTQADEALQDILDQLNSSPKIQRAYAKDIAGVENMLKKGEYTLSELNNIRRAYDKVNTGMFTVQGKARSGLENDIDVKVRRGLSDQLQKEAKKFGVDVKGMNTELRAGLEMKDALLSRLSQEERNNFLGLQDLGVSAILSGGNPASAVATIAAKKYAEKVAPGLAQKAYNLNKNPNVTRRVSRGNTITPRNKSSGLGLASSSSTPMVSDAVKPHIVPKAKPKATTESALKTTPIAPEKKSIVAKKEVSTIPITDVKKEPKFIRNGGLTDDNGIYKDHRYKNEVYKKEFIANSDIEGTVIKKGDRVAISEESGSKGKRYVAILQKGVKDENGFYITSEPNIKLSNFYKDSSTPIESAFKSAPVVPEKKSIVAKKESTVKTPEIKSEKVPLDTKDFIYKNLDQAEGYIKWHEKMLAVPGKSKKEIKYLQDGLEEAKREASIFKNNKGFINPSEIKKSLVPKKGADEARQFYDDLVYAGNSPIVAQRETAKRFGTIRAMSASKAGTFGGEGAKEAPKTGWFKGADGKMKFEIDDSKANFEFPKRTNNESRIQNAKANFETAKLDDVQIKDAMEIDGFKGTPKEYRDELIKHGYEDMYNIKSGNYRLGDILQHSDLYKQYPWLENTPVSFHTEGGMRSAGEMTNGKISIALNAKDPKSVILHEIQHIIQEKEGFARGGNPESFKQGIEYYKKLADYNRDILGDIRYDKMLEKDKTSIAYKKLVKEEEEALRTYKIANEKYKELSSTSPMESYNNQAGEVESRNVQTRMNMTAKERALKSPESTEDVPRNKQIVRFKNDGTSMSIDKAGTMDISKAHEALVQEAKKYKSADDFIKAQLQPDDVVMFQGKVVKLKNFSGGLGAETKKWSGVDSKGDPVFHMSSKNIEPYRFSDRYGQIDVDSSLKSLTKNTSELKKKYENEIAIFDNYNSYKNKGVDEITIDKILTKRDPKWKDKLSVGEEAKNMIEGKLNDVPDFSKRKSIQELKQIYEQAHKK